jgi:uncharacterized protein YjbI with pentapeptide repeats
VGDADGVLLEGPAAHLPRDVELTRSHVHRARFAGARLDGWHLTDCLIGHSDLAGVVLSQASVLRCAVSDSRLSGSGVEGGLLKDVTLTDVLAPGLSLRFCTLTRVVLQRCTLPELDLTGATLENVSILDCDLTGADLRQLSVRSARIARTTMIGVTGASLLGGCVIDAGVLADISATLAKELGITVQG